MTPKEIEGYPVIFHVVMDIEKMGLTKKQAMHQDMAQEYAVVTVTEGHAGIMVYAKYNDSWQANPWSTRFLIRELLERINITLPKHNGQ